MAARVQEILPELSVSTEEEQKGVRYFLYHGYFSCERRKRSKLFATITLWVYEKVTNKNTGKHDTLRLATSRPHEFR